MSVTFTCFFQKTILKLYFTAYVMRKFNFFIVGFITLLAMPLLAFNSAYAIDEYELGTIPDENLIDEIESLFRTIPQSEIQAIELARRPDPIIMNETRQFLVDLEKECTQKTNQYQLRNTETKIKDRLSLLRQFSILEPNSAKLETQVTEYTALCVSESEFNREKLKIDSLLSNASQIRKYQAVADSSLLCDLDISQSIFVDYNFFTTSYTVLKTYNDSIISRYNQIVVDDLALFESTEKLSERNSEIGQITSQVIEDQSLLDLKLKTAIAEKNKFYEELRNSYATLTKQNILNLAEIKQSIDSPDVAIGLSLDEGETWMITNDTDELFRYFSLLKNNSDQVKEIKNITKLYSQRSEDIESSLAQKVALNLVLDIYAQESARNNDIINSNNEKREKIAAVSETHRLLAEERKKLDREYLNNSSTLHTAFNNCSIASEAEFNKYKAQYDSMNGDFKKYIDDTFQSTLTQKELTVMADVKSASISEPQLVFTVATKLSKTLTELSSCNDKQALDIQINSEPLSTVTVAGLAGIAFQVDGNDGLSKDMNDLQSLSASEMPFNDIDINYFVSNLNTKLTNSFQGVKLGNETLKLTPMNTWTQDIVTNNERYVTYECVNSKWEKTKEKSIIKVEKGFCKNLDLQAISIVDGANIATIPELVKANIDQLILEKQFKIFGTCQTN